jgi:carbamoyltransferase
LTIVLGIHDGHLATAALVKDGKLVACVSEERFSRVKNQSGFPAKAIDFVLREGGVTSSELDLAVLAGFDLAPIGGTQTSANDGSLRGIYSTISPIRNAWGSIEYHVPAFQSLGNLGYRLYSRPGFNLTRRERLKKLRGYLNLSPSKIRVLEHHYCHAYSAMYGPAWSGREFLVMTLDGEGDEICASVNLVQDGKMKRLAVTPKKASLGWIYAEVTRYLGMKPLEHEYKVMGLAPYAQPESVDKSYKLMRKLVRIGVSNPLIFEAPFRTNLTYRYLRAHFASHRFDWVAGATQKLAEDLITQWISSAVKETGVHRVALSGGVFMNVKANLRVMEMDGIEELFIFPSCGDESNPIGAAWWGYDKITGENPEPLRDLYLGPEFGEAELETTLKAQRFEYQKHGDIEKVIAELVSKGKVVARMKGRMEWGARALGNRSILADPSDWETVRVINNMIKQRDFWMPFAPSILEESEDEYIENPKRMPAPYMIVAFNSKELGRKQFRAAMHPYDFTLRPQIVAEDWNPTYSSLLKNFKKYTGIGGVLNTSFNLHGEPVVCNPSDAMHVLKDSGLQYLAIGDYLVNKPQAAS